MAAGRSQAISDFFGIEQNVEVSRGQGPQVALATDNARLFVGNVINNYANTTNQDAFSIDGSSISSSVAQDPILMTSKVLRSVVKVTDTLRGCQRKAAKVKIADLSIATLHTECSSLRLRLNQIKSLIGRDDDLTLEERYEIYVLEEYEDVLQACCLPFSILSRHLEKLGLNSTYGTGRDEFKLKLQEFWAYERMEMVCHNIRGLSRAVDILCSAFQSETAAKASNVIGNPTVKKLLESIGNDAVSLHESFESAKGIHERSIRESIANDEVFEFDNILTNTTLYKKAYMRQTVRAQQVDVIDDAIISVVDQQPAIAISAINRPTIMEDKIDHGTELLHNNQVHGPDDNSNVSQNLVKLDLGPQPQGESESSAYEDVVETLRKMDAVQHDGLIGSNPVTLPNRRSSIDSTSSHDTIRAKPESSTTQDSAASNTNSILTSASSSDDKRILTAAQNTALTREMPWSPDDPSSHYEMMAISTATRDYVNVPSAPAKGPKVPTLADVLHRRTLKPYGLYEFYVYMRDVQRSVDYLDFWLDTTQHMALCRHYVRILRNSMPEEYGSDELKAVTRADLTASAEKILYTFLLPGSEREIVLPQSIISQAIRDVEEDRRDDPEVFDAAKEYVFRAMENDAFPGFLESGKLFYRGLRRAFGPLANGFMPRTRRGV